MAIDEFSLKTIDTLIKRKYFEDIENLIQIGKEAEVYNLKFENNNRIIKIYRINNLTFANLDKYIRNDFRFKNLKGSRRKIIFEWVKKEFRNLKKCENIINSPKPIKFLNNCIVMEKIEGDLLKNSTLKSSKKVFEKIIDMVFILKNKVKLIHGDLSEFNIIIDKKDEPFFIDFGQSFIVKTEYDLEKSKHFLKRDIENIITFFEKKHKLKINREDIFKRFF